MWTSISILNIVVGCIYDDPIGMHYIVSAVNKIYHKCVIILGMANVNPQTTSTTTTHTEVVTQLYPS